MIIHEPPCDGPEPTYEYLLPFQVDEIAEARQSLLSPWFRRFEGLGSDEVGALMAEGWQNLEGNSIRRLCDYLVAMRPRSISLEKYQVWLCFCDSDADCTEFAIHEPRQLTAEQGAFVDSFGLPELRSLSEHFYDTYEGVDTYVCCGLQVGAEPLEGEHRGEMGDWAGGISLYLIPNGDFLLMNREQQVGRWYHEVAWDSSRRDECAVEPFADSLDAFMQIYFEYLQTPMDARMDTLFFQKAFY